MTRWIALCLLLPALAWADSVEEAADIAAGRALLQAEMLNAEYITNSKGVVTVIFGRSVGPGFIEAVVMRLKREPAIRGVNHTQVDHDFCKAP
ncbi:MAG: hypothetical protein AB1482_04420 [Pseudomonadota bacterium]